MPTPTDSLPAVSRPDRPDRRNPSRWLQAVLTALAIAVVLAMNGMIPGVFLPTRGIFYVFAGESASLARGSLFGYPAHFGHPYGAPVLYGLPANLLQAVLIRAGADLATSYVLAGAIFLIGAFFGGQALFRRAGCPAWLATAGSTIFLCSIFLIGHRSYTALMLAFALLPTSVLLDQRLHDHFAVDAPRRRAGGAGLVLAYLAGRVLLVFMDGYTFIISGVFSAVYLCDALIRRAREPHGLARCAMHALVAAGSSLAAAGIYVWYAPAALSYTTMPADFFRAQAVDVATLLVPFNQPTVLSVWLGWPGRLTAFRLYGDGSNAFHNYLGLGFLAAAGGLIWAWRCRRPLLPVAGGGLLCLILALGPSLKLHDFKPDAPVNRPIQFADYLMPPSAATLNFHTDSFFTRTPGVKSMRSVYRWLLGFKLALLFFALLAIAALLRHRRIAWAVALLALLAADSIPYPSKLFAAYSRMLRDHRRFETDVVAGLRAAVPPHSLLLFVSRENDYLACALAAELDCVAYNTGGDKNLEIARRAWPAGVGTILQQHDVIATARQLHQRGQLDVLVLPHFNLRWNAYSWPPAPAAVRTAERQAAALIPASHPDFEVIRARYFTAVKFAPQH